MEVTILLFGITKDFVGKRMVKMQLSPSISVAEFKNALQEEYPKLLDLNSVAIAVNSEYADDFHILKPNDEIALIPPVSGG